MFSHFGLCRELFFLIFTTASVINVSVRLLVRVRAKTGCLATRYVYQRTVVSVGYQSKGPIKCVGLVQSRHHHHPHLIEMYLLLEVLSFSAPLVSSIVINVKTNLVIRYIR